MPTHQELVALEHKARSLVFDNDPNNLLIVKMINEIVDSLMEESEINKRDLPRPLQPDRISTARVSIADNILEKSRDHMVEVSFGEGKDSMLMTLQVKAYRINGTTYRCNGI